MEKTIYSAGGNTGAEPRGNSSLFERLTLCKRWLDRGVAGLCITLVASMTLLVTYQVLSRYIFNSPSAVSEVLSRYLFIWLVLIGGAYVFGLREHMAITFMRDRMSRSLRLVLEMLGELAVTLFALMVMVIGGYSGMMRQMGQLDSALQIPIGVIYAAIPLSGAMILFYCFYNQLVLGRQLFGGKED